ncbi:MAG: metalloregulator ArsR/SmtB family transcription factor [Actinomycetota bacterium]|nr:metalloregulator ArsR/SmtB family transcription factor [Actinomycetota bacterium]
MHPSTFERVSVNLRVVPSLTIDPWYALADPTRRSVFARVAKGPCSVTEIARDLPVSRPAVSQHLRVLLDAHLVDVRTQGRERLYRPRPDGLDWLRNELETYWTQTLATFKSLAEQTYESSTSESKGTPSP